MDQRDVAARRKQQLEECLENHSQYSTSLMTEVQWKLQVEFVKKTDDVWETIEDPYITEEQMLDFHSNIRTVMRLFGLPQIGDFVHGGGELSRVVERTFDVDKKIVTITVS